MANPRVSVLIPSWESAVWLGDAIESAFGQDWTDLEVVVVDDGSTDATPAVAERFTDRIRFESIPHSGANAARNRLLEMARGEWLQFLDADDILLPQKLSRQLQAAGPDVDVIASPCLNSAGEIRRGPADEDVWISFLGARLGVTSSTLFRAERVRAVGGWDPNLRSGQEQALMLALLSDGARVAVVPEPLCVKRHVNPDSLWRKIWRDDPKAALESDVTSICRAVRRLRQSGELTPARRRAAGARFLRIASGVWRRGEDWKSVLGQAADLGLGRAELVSESPWTYRAVYARLGFARAQQWSARRKGLGKRLRRDLRRCRRTAEQAGRAALRRLKPGATDSR
jgi:hypothetical protein